MRDTTVEWEVDFTESFIRSKNYVTAVQMTVPELCLWDGGGLRLPVMWLHEMCRGTIPLWMSANCKRPSASLFHWAIPCEHIRGHNLNGLSHLVVNEKKTRLSGIKKIYKWNYIFLYKYREFTKKLTLFSKKWNGAEYGLHSGSECVNDCWIAFR